MYFCLLLIQLLCSLMLIDIDTDMFFLLAVS